MTVASLLFLATQVSLLTQGAFAQAAVPGWCRALPRPETDLDAYGASIRIKLVLGAHNIPIAPPSVLPRLVHAFDAVRAGKVSPTPDSPGQVIYKVDDIAFLMRAGGPRH